MTKDLLLYFNKSSSLLTNDPLGFCFITNDTCIDLLQTQLSLFASLMDLVNQTSVLMSLSDTQLPIEIMDRFFSFDSETQYQMLVTDLNGDLDLLIQKTLLIINNYI